MLQVYCISQSVYEGSNRSGDRACSWVATVVLDARSFYATCPWEMLVTRDFNQPLSQRGMFIPIALCSIAIVVVDWPAVGSCFPAKTLLCLQLVVIFASHPPTTDPLCIPFRRAKYEGHVKISYFNRFYRIIETSSSVLRVSLVTVNIRSGLRGQRLIYVKEQHGNSIEI